MLCVMMLPLVVVGCTSAVCQSREATIASGVRDNAASPRLADTAERDYFTLRERLITSAKNNWKEPRSILMSSVDRVAQLSDGQLHAIIVSNTRASAEYKCLKQ